MNERRMTLPVQVTITQTPQLQMQMTPQSVMSSTHHSLITSRTQLFINLVNLKSSVKQEVSQSHQHPLSLQQQQQLMQQSLFKSSFNLLGGFEPGFYNMNFSFCNTFLSIQSQQLLKCALNLKDSYHPMLIQDSKPLMQQPLYSYNLNWKLSNAKNDHQSWRHESHLDAQCTQHQHWQWQVIHNVTVWLLWLQFQSVHWRTRFHMRQMKLQTD